MALQLFRGGIGLVGQRINQIAAETPTDGHSFARSDASYHITLVSKDELRTLPASPSPAEVLQRLQTTLNSEAVQLHPLGLGGYPRHTPEVFFTVVVWAKGQQLRKLLGLPPKHFHITLSQRDVHSIDKGISSLVTDISSETLSPDALDHLVFTLYSMDDMTRAKEYAVQLCRRSPSSEKGFLRLGDTALKLSEYKLGMLAYACAYTRAGSEMKIQEYCLRRLVSCAKDTEWGPVFTEWEIEQLPEDLLDHLLEPWSSDLHAAIDALALDTPTLCRHSRDQLFIPAAKSSAERFYRLPRFFRWLVPFKLALMSTPRNGTDIAALASPYMGIQHVITLTEEAPLAAEWFACTKIKNTFLPIPNYHPPTIEQMDLIIRILCDNPSPTLIHCGGGKGRAGTVAACYLAAFGFSKPPAHDVLRQPTISAPEAITALRAIRPGSIETQQQEDFVSKWCSTIWKRQSVFPETVPEPFPSPLEIEGTLDASSNFFILVGLPGSGKSWFSRALLARDPSGWTTISQDDAGNRSACETAIGRARTKGRVLLDRCNTAREDRRAWIALAAHWAVAPVCVWFDYDAALCTYRAQNRAGHPTLPPGGRVRSAVEQMRKVFVAPELGEGFSAVIRVRSFEAAEELVGRLSPPVGLFKFPRTPHLLDLGAATSDDLVSDLAGLSVLASENATQVVVTEKVDGANMGFSLSADRTQIVVQNRSHYVNPASHAQFKKLGTWVEEHRNDLYKILDRDPYFAQRYILFGEWLAATHSVSYTRLPDWFLAFDLYDRSTDTWADRRTLTALLSDTSIRMVPVLHEGQMVGEDELKAMAQRKSNYTDGRVEGVYVKFERRGKVVSRGKVVRSDFIAGNEHWSKGPLQTNTLEY